MPSGVGTCGPQSGWSGGGSPGCSPRLTQRYYSPALRSLSRLKPTMTLEEGIGQATQEWQRKSNFDRMTYYDMAAK